MLTKSEFCQFSLTGKIQLLDEFGKLLYIKEHIKHTIIIYRLYNFYVQAVYRGNIPEKAEPISNDMMELFHNNN